jgi:sarcosine oxidase subunit gamma
MPDAGQVASTRTVAVAEAPPAEVLMLRIRRPDEGVMGALAGVLGATPPSTPNTTAGSDPRTLWTAPSEWMISGRNVAALAPQIAEACEGSVHHLADVGSGYSIFVVRGASARDLLAKGCSLDLHPRAFQPNRCARTLLAQVRVLIDQLSDEPVFHIYADASYAGHLRAWFDDARREFQS